MGKATALVVVDVVLLAERAASRLTGRALTAEECLERFIEDFTRTWSGADRQVHRERRGALESAGYRCMVPVCTARQHLHVHHIVFRSQGGSDDPGNLVVLCQAHPLRHVHRGLVRVDRQVDGQLRWEVGRPRVVFVGERRVMAS